jgi:hypothetical protein
VKQTWIRIPIALGLVLLVVDLRADPSRLGEPVRSFAAPGDYPEGLCWDGTHLWVNNFTDGSLAKVDPASGATLATYRGGGLPASPEGLAWDGERLWTCDWRTGRIFALRETETGIQILSWHDKPAGAGSTVGLEWDGSHLWLATWYSELHDRGQLWKLDPQTLEALAMLPLPVHWVEDLAWDGRYLWSVDWLFAIGFAIDPATGDTLHTYRTPGRHPVGQAWDGEFLWLGDTESDSLWALDISAARPTPVKRLHWSDVKQSFRDR